ncbi:MAG: hypothetical protein ICV83_18895, partial [Cytophagales bacterium]|nr:hypothetical protein [Cytophagales bacterium]
MTRNCISLLFLLLVGLTARAQTTWTGTTSADWNTASNWSGNAVPSATDNVVILDVAGNDPVINAGTAALANWVLVERDGVLTIGSSGSLTINGSTPSNYYFTTTAFFNLGTVNNSGQLVIGNLAPVGENGLSNFGSFNNNPGGQIGIDRSTTAGLFNRGSFTNGGVITIGGTAAVGSKG